ncbi:hypothetical protein ACLOJK_022176 [Asimina triloba]
MSGLNEGVGGARLLEDEVFVELTGHGPPTPLGLPAPRRDVDFGEPPTRQREFEGDGFLQDKDSLKEMAERLVEEKKERLKEAANAKERRRGWWRGKGRRRQQMWKSFTEVGGRVEVDCCKMMVETARLKELSLCMVDVISDFSSPPFPDCSHSVSAITPSGRTCGLSLEETTRPRCRVRAPPRITTRTEMNGRWKSFAKVGGKVEVDCCKMMVETARLKELSLCMVDVISDFSSLPFPDCARMQSTGATSNRHTNGNERKVEMKENRIRRFAGAVRNAKNGRTRLGLVQLCGSRKKILKLGWHLPSLQHSAHLPGCMVW